MQDVCRYQLVLGQIRKLFVMQHNHVVIFERKAICLLK